MAGLHIVSQEERLIVIPGHVTAKELDDYLKHQTVVVIMKLSQCIDEVHQCIINHPEYQYHYFENVGTRRNTTLAPPKNFGKKDTLISR